MPIIRHRAQNPAHLSTINTAALLDPRLSPTARLIHFFIMYGTEPGWDWDLRGISEALNIGKYSVRKGMTELVDCLYVRKVQQKEEGRYLPIDYHFFEEEALEEWKAEVRAKYGEDAIL
ncbi:MAG TPA: hypothetical protein VFI02_09395 [Armatimonadota bacterium]|nr:hypothetical protein [Armatimonadota bacterium]